MNHYCDICKRNFSIDDSIHVLGPSYRTDDVYLVCFRCKLMIEEIMSSEHRKAAKEIRKQIQKLSEQEK